MHGIEAVRDPATGVLRANACAERFVLTTRTVEVTDRMLASSANDTLRSVMAECRGVPNRAEGAAAPSNSSPRPTAPTTPWPISAQERVKRRPVLGGLLNEHGRAA